MVYEVYDEESIKELVVVGVQEVPQPMIALAWVPSAQTRP